MLKPLISFDLDGTLLDRRGRIHPQDIALLRMPDAPAIFVPATGRSLDSLKATFSEDGLFAGQAFGLPAVLQNGSLVLDAGERVVDYRTLPQQAIDGLVDAAGRFPGVAFLFFDQTRQYLLNDVEFGVLSARKYRFEIGPFEHTLTGHSFGKVMALSENPAELATLAEVLTTTPLEAAYSMPTILEMWPVGVSKASGIQTLASHLGMQGMRWLAAGDGGNDLAMLQAADQTFVPTSAPEEIRALADVLVDRQAEGLFRPMLRAAGIELPPIHP